MKLSNQAAGALMMALQKCLLEQQDITGILNDMEFEVGKGFRFGNCGHALA